MSTGNILCSSINYGAGAELSSAADLAGAGAVTVTPAQLVGGVLLNTYNGGATTISLPTGAALASFLSVGFTTGAPVPPAGALLTPLQVGFTMRVTIINANAGGGSWTISGAIAGYNYPAATLTVGTGAQVDLIIQYAGANVWNLFY